MLAVEVPIAAADADALGLALARILGIADRLLDEVAGWLWLGGQIPDQGDGSRRNEAFLARYAGRAAGAVRRMRPARALRARTASSLARRARRGDRAASPHLASTAEVRAATPDLTIVGDARYDVQPDQHRVRVTVDLTLTNHLTDTKTKRYYFDHGVPRGPARGIGRTS